VKAIFPSPTVPPSPPAISLPSLWPDHVKSGLLHALALGHFAITHVRGWCANSPIARVRVASECERIKAEVALLREELRSKDSRMASDWPSSMEKTLRVVV
jgi:hypothetical protein